MLRLDRLSKDFREAGALNQQINLYGFIDEHTFLTKTGDVGVLLEVQGLDYESLDSGSVDTYTKRLESAMRLFDDRCRLYPRQPKLYLEGIILPRVLHYDWTKNREKVTTTPVSL